MSSASVPLAARLRSATQALHTQVERSGLMAQLLRGQLPAAGYLLMLRNLQAIYAAMEDGLRQHASHPGVSPLHADDLFRMAAIESDLLDLHGPDWRDALPLAPAALAYVQRLQALAADWPAGLAAHAYVRYLGDLSGGQALQRIVASRYAPSPGQGTAFYDFGPREAVARRALALRSALDLIAPDEATAGRLAAEAVQAFAAHGELFEQLAAMTAPG